MKQLAPTDTKISTRHIILMNFCLVHTCNMGSDTSYIHQMKITAHHFK